jgi:hypothetical protein
MNQKKLFFSLALLLVLVLIVFKFMHRDRSVNATEQIQPAISEINGNKVEPAMAATPSRLAPGASLLTGWEGAKAKVGAGQAYAFRAEMLDADGKNATIDGATDGTKMAFNHRSGPMADPALDGDWIVYAGRPYIRGPSGQYLPVGGEGRVLDRMKQLISQLPESNIAKSATKIGPEIIDNRNVEHWQLPRGPYWERLDLWFDVSKGELVRVNSAASDGSQTQITWHDFGVLPTLPALPQAEKGVDFGP